MEEDGAELVFEVFGGGNADADVVAGVAGPVSLGRFFEKDIQGFSEVCAVKLAGFFGADVMEFHAALVGDGRRDFFGDAAGRGGGAFGIFEDMGKENRTFLQQLGALFEIFFGFAGKSHHKIGSDADAGHAVVGELDKLQKLFAGVVAFHGGKDVVGSGLRGDMQEGHERMGRVVHQLEEFFGDGGGFNGTDADALEAGKFAESGGDVVDVFFVIGVGAEIDAGEDDFFCAAADELAGLVEQVGDFARPDPSAREGDDAEAAHEVAAILDFQVCTAAKKRGPVRR